jgi:hypothetical protein
MVAQVRLRVQAAQAEQQPLLVRQTHWVVAVETQEMLITLAILVLREALLLQIQVWVEGLVGHIIILQQVVMDRLLL